MSRLDLIEGVSRLLGVDRARFEAGENDREVIVTGAQGQRLFTISLFEKNGGWHFGGTGSLLREHWGQLCDLGDSK